VKNSLCFIDVVSNFSYFLYSFASRIKGKIEGKIEDAIAMKAEGISDDVIARITGISIEEIEKL